MNDLTFLAALTCLLALLLTWGFTHLPGERWQMLASIPRRKRDDGQWQGTNLTYYGFFIATSQLLAICLLMILLGAAHISLVGSLLTTGLLLLFCIPAARIVAILVEKKRHTFTVGGASFVGIVLAPWSILLVEKILNTSFFPCYLPMLPVLAAMAVAYTLGEGLGRLGCISFGCCYGKRISDCGPLTGQLFRKVAFIFNGPTKKAIYEGKLTGEPLVPIQAITCILYCATAILGSLLFLHGQATAALILSIGVSQIWRIVSETLRADFRGFAEISAYQKMGTLAVLYIILVAGLSPIQQISAPDISLGLRLLWQPGLILGLQILWLVFFVFFGRSTVTTSTLSFQLVRENL
jgi:prolipoprotein diacylglyceryltransferase